MPSELFMGERLQLAREFRNLTQRELGEKVAASSSLVSFCETGKKQDPARDLVEAFGEVLGFQPGFFYSRIEDVFREEECSFRHKRSTSEKLKSQIRAHGTLIGMVVRELRGVFRFPALNVPSIKATSLEEVENAAEQSRKYWGLGIDAPLVHIGRVMEHAGVIIVPHVVPSVKVDAFSRRGDITLLFLNQSIQSTSRWVFDVAHECGHLVMHGDLRTGAIETEKEADRFASAFLMPKTAFSREFRASRSFSWEHVFALKRRWQTSAAAIVRRAYDLGLLDAVSYRRAYQYMSFKKWTKGEPFEPSFQAPELLASSLKGLGNQVQVTIVDLVKKLQFSPETFRDVTGIEVPPPKLGPKAVTPILPRQE